MKILGGDEGLLGQLKSIAPDPKFLPVVALFHREQPDLDQLKRDWGAYMGFVGDKKMPVLAVQGDRVVYAPKNQPTTYIQWSERVHALQGDSELVRRRMSVDHSGDRPPIFKNESLEVYETSGPGDCIKYGKGYSFCISQPGNTMWQSYRDTQTSTFYFVYDKSLPEDDPLHVVVVDITKDGPKLTDAKNTTGVVSKFGADAKSYLEHLYEMGVPRGLFKNKPHTEEEREETELLGRYNSSIEWFKGLSPESKSKYIGRGHELTNDQFDYIFDNGVDSLTKQYVEVGRKLNDHQMDKILGSKFRSTYLHFRLIANQNSKDLDFKEYDRLNERQRESLSDDLKFAMLLKKGSRDEAMKLLPTSPSDLAVSAAAETGDIDILGRFEKSGFIDRRRLLSSVIAAVKGESVESIRWLVERGGPPRYAFKVAAKRGDMELLVWLVDKDEEYEEANPSKDGPEVQLHYAAEAAAKMGWYEIFSYLTDPKNNLVDLSAEWSWTKVGQQLLSKALSSPYAKDKPGQIKIIKVLLEKGFELSFFDIYSAIENKSEQIVDMLLDLDREGKKDKFSYSLLRAAAQADDINALKRVIEEMEKRGIPVKGRAYSIISGAGASGSTEILDFVHDDLLQKSEKLTEFEMGSALIAAIYHSKTKVMDWLLKKGLKLDEEHVDMAVSANQIDSVKWLVGKMGERGIVALRQAIAKYGDVNAHRPEQKVDRSPIRKYADSLKA